MKQNLQGNLERHEVKTEETLLYWGYVNAIQSTELDYKLLVD